MLKLRLVEAAAEDLRDIRIYSKAQFGAVVARGYLDGIAGSIAMLRQRPGVGAEENDLAAGIRGFTYRSHRLYYQVDRDTLIVVRILHHARNAQRWIGREP